MTVVTFLIFSGVCAVAWIFTVACVCLFWYGTRDKT